MKPRNILAAVIAFAAPGLLAMGLSAQDLAGPAKAKRTDKLRKALTQMARIKSVAFTASTTTIANAKNAIVRIAGAGGGAKAKVTHGVLSGDVLSLSLNDEEDQVVIHGRRMIAKNDDNGWTLRRSRLRNGATLPFVFDPELFFSTLSQLPLKVMHTEAGTVNNKPVETYTISITGKRAKDLVWGGVLPEPGAGGGPAGVLRVVMRGGGGVFGVGAPNAPKMTIDLAISIDPATNLVHEVKVRSYSKANNRFGGMVIRAGGGGFGEEEDDEEEAEEEDFDPQNPKFKGALPVRKKKDKTFMKFDLSLKQHNNAVLPDLSARARTLLNLPR